jgi:hypothetical protein
MCVKSTWIRRIKDMDRDGMDYIGAIIMDMGGTEYDQIGSDVDVGGGDIICVDILMKWSEYKRDYYRIGNNILEAHLFENKGAFEENATVNSLVFDQGRYRELRENVRGIRVRRLLDGQLRFKSKQDVEVIFGRDITWVEYFRLRTTIQQRVDDRRDNDGNGNNVALLMGKGKIKSSSLRRKIVGVDSEVYMRNDPRTITAVRTLWGRRVDEKERRFVELNLRTWVISVLDPDFKEFCLNFYTGGFI